MSRPKPDWAEFRRHMPVAERWAYFDHAAVAPLPEPARAALATWADEVCRDGDIHYPQWAKQLQETRKTAAFLLRADEDEVALTHSTTEGIGFVAEGFPWQPGDNVVTRADEFPSNLYPWMHLADRGVETRRIAVGEDGRLDFDRLAGACDQRTRILALSWVCYGNGWRHDLDRLAEFAHRRGILLFIDAIQGLGVFPLDVKQTPIDFLAADGHKWLLGPEGAGVFYLRKEHLNLLRPLGVGWNSVVEPHDFQRIELTLKPSAARYEGGSPNMGGHLALGASLELLGQFGPKRIGARVIEVTDEACRRLEEAGAEVVSNRQREHASGIVVFDLPGRDPQAVRQRCLGQGVVLSCRAGRLRISPHAYNDSTDIDRLIEAIR